MKRIGVIFFTLFAIGVMSYWWFNEPRPQGIGGVKADELALNMLNYLNFEAYEKARQISWTYVKDDRHYRWDKANNQVEVKWNNTVVNFFPSTMQGSATKEEKLLEGEALNEALNQAWEYFANDSFWLVAPFKVFDAGTKREMVALESGEGLLVTYSSGGVTPGDSYLWILDDTYRPKSWKMWTQKVPLGGIEFTWTDWNQYNGCWLASSHHGLIDVKIDNIVVK